jgi:hypothetical protein
MMLCEGLGTIYCSENMFYVMKLQRYDEICFRLCSSGKSQWVVFSDCCVPMRTMLYPTLAKNRLHGGRFTQRSVHEQYHMNSNGTHAVAAPVPASHQVSFDG